MWVSMPDVFPQRFRGCEYCVSMPLAGWFWCWMGSSSEKDKRKFSHLRTLHGKDDITLIWLLPGLLLSASFKSVEVQQFLEETWACNAASKFGNGLRSWLQIWVLRLIGVSVVWRLACNTNTGPVPWFVQGLFWHLPAPSTVMLLDVIRCLLCPNCGYSPPVTLTFFPEPIFFKCKSTDNFLSIFLHWSLTSDRTACPGADWLSHHRSHFLLHLQSTGNSLVGAFSLSIVNKLHFSFAEPSPGSCFPQKPSEIPKFHRVLGD